VLAKLAALYNDGRGSEGAEKTRLWGRRIGTMPLFMDHHRHVEGLTAEAVAEAHRKDEEIQDEYGVKYHRYWFNEETGEVFCLAEAPNKEAAEAVHREAHGLMADEITEVKEGA
jgi:hypothetical protein